MNILNLSLASGLLLGSSLALAHTPHQHDSDTAQPSTLIEVYADSREERTRLADLGYALDEMLSDKVYIFGSERDAENIRQAGFEAKAIPVKEEWLKWNSTFAKDDELSQSEREFHSYQQVSEQLQAMALAHPEIVSLTSLGKTLENREVPMLRISGKSIAEAAREEIPVAFYMGCHHAREHLSVEVPLMFAQYLVENYGRHPDVTRLVDSREIYIAPIVNPDGHVYDFSGRGRGRMWRKNRAQNSDGSIGVDLNRNYGFKWGTGGSSDRGSSEVYMGPAPFSEPETQNIRDFVRSQPRMKVLLSLHTFSELILYPWGFTYDDLGTELGNPDDLPVFEKMANQMAQWNHYTPQQSSDLYITSGDTTDWAYGELGIYAFTFELTPKSLWDGGFYPSPTVIQPTFDENLKPMLYLLEYADDPTRVLTEKAPNFLNTPAKSGVPMASFRDIQL